MSAEPSTPDCIHAVLHQIVESIDRYHMIANGQRVVVALSGGPDSTVLAHALAQLADRYRIQLAAAHCNHGLRSDADRDEAAARELAEHLGMRFFRTALDVRAHGQRHRLSLETAGRQLRYEYFQRLAADHRFHRVAVGHHREDSVEQVLLNMIRGCGATGLSGIQPIRDGWVIRPLIRVRRESIIAYARAARLPMVLDASNLDRRYTRNRVRHELLPMLEKKFNPRIGDALARLAEMSADETCWMNAMAESLTATALEDHTDRHMTFSAKALADFPPAAGRRVLRQSIRRILGHLERITLDHVDNALALATAPHGAGQLDLPWRVRVTRRGPVLRIEQREQPHRTPTPAAIDYQIAVARPSPDAARSVSVPDVGPGTRIDFSNKTPETVTLGGQAGHRVAFFDMDALSFPLVVRNWRPGDRLRPLGMSGTKKVRRLLSEHRVPNESRSTWPVVISADEIIWVPGLGRGESARLSPHTRSVLAAQVVTGDTPLSETDARTGTGHGSQGENR